MIEQAQQYHQMLDAAKYWSLQEAAKLEERADLAEEHDIDTDESPEEMRQTAQIIRTVASRIRPGDEQKVREIIE